MKITMKKLISAVLALLLVIAVLALAEEPADGIIAPEGETADIEAAEVAPEVRAEATDPTIEETELDLDAIDGEPTGEEPGAPVDEAIVEDAEEAGEDDEDVVTDETPEIEEATEDSGNVAEEAEASEDEETEAEDVPEAPEADEVTEAGEALEEEVPEAEEPAEAEEAPETVEDPEAEAVTGAAVALPVPNELTYTGEAQALVSGEGWLFSLDGEAYSAEAPAAVNAGEYIVYFVPADDAGAEARSLTVAIAKADVAFTPPVAAGGEA